MSDSVLPHRFLNKEWVAYLNDEGEEYYYNLCTAETTWDLPVIVSQSESKIDLMPAVTSEGQNLQHSSAEDLVTTPPNNQATSSQQTIENVSIKDIDTSISKNKDCPTSTTSTTTSTTAAVTASSKPAKPSKPTKPSKLTVNTTTVKTKTLDSNNSSYSDLESIASTSKSVEVAMTSKPAVTIVLPVAATDNNSSTSAVQTETDTEPKHSKEATNDAVLATPIVSAVCTTDITATTTTTRSTTAASASPVHSPKSTKSVNDAVVGVMETASADIEAQRDSKKAKVKPVKAPKLFSFLKSSSRPAATESPPPSSSASAVEDNPGSQTKGECGREIEQPVSVSTTSTAAIDATTSATTTTTAVQVPSQQKRQQRYIYASSDEEQEEVCVGTVQQLQCSGGCESGRESATDPPSSSDATVLAAAATTTASGDSATADAATMPAGGEQSRNQTRPLPPPPPPPPPVPASTTQPAAVTRPPTPPPPPSPPADTQGAKASRELGSEGAAITATPPCAAVEGVQGVPRRAGGRVPPPPPPPPAVLPQETDTVEECGGTVDVVVLRESAAVGAQSAEVEEGATVDSIKNDPDQGELPVVTDTASGSLAVCGNDNDITADPAPTEPSTVAAAVVEAVCEQASVNPTTVPAQSTKAPAPSPPPAAVTVVAPIAVRVKPPKPPKRPSVAPVPAAPTAAATTAGVDNSAAVADTTASSELIHDNTTAPTAEVATVCTVTTEAALSVDTAAAGEQVPIAPQSESPPCPLTVEMAPDLSSDVSSPFDIELDTGSDASHFSPTTTTADTAMSVEVTLVRTGDASAAAVLEVAVATDERATTPVLLVEPDLEEPVAVASENGNDDERLTAIHQQQQQGEQEQRDSIDEQIREEWGYGELEEEAMKTVEDDVTATVSVPEVASSTEEMEQEQDVGEMAVVVVEQEGADSRCVGVIADGEERAEKEEEGVAQECVEQACCCDGGEEEADNEEIVRTMASAVSCESERVALPPTPTVPAPDLPSTSLNPFDDEESVGMGEGAASGASLASPFGQPSASPVSPFGQPSASPVNLPPVAASGRAMGAWGDSPTAGASTPGQAGVRSMGAWNTPSTTPNSAQPAPPLPQQPPPSTAPGGPAGRSPLLAIALSKKNEALRTRSPNRGLATPNTPPSPAITTVAYPVSTTPGGSAPRTGQLGVASRQQDSPLMSQMGHSSSHGTLSTHQQVDDSTSAGCMSRDDVPASHLLRTGTGMVRKRNPRPSQVLTEADEVDSIMSIAIKKLMRIGVKVQPAREALQRCVTSNRAVNHYYNALLLVRQALIAGLSLDPYGNSIWSPRISSRIKSWMPNVLDAETKDYHTGYIMTVTYNRLSDNYPQNWQLTLRYSIFRNLNARISKYIAGTSFDHRAHFPSKVSTFFTGMTDRVRNDRMQQLDMWLREVLSSALLMTIPEVAEAVLEVLEVEARVSD